MYFSFCCSKVVKKRILRIAGTGFRSSSCRSSGKTYWAYPAGRPGYSGDSNISWSVRNLLVSALARWSLLRRWREATACEQIYLFLARAKL